MKPQTPILFVCGQQLLDLPSVWLCLSIMMLTPPQIMSAVPSTSMDAEKKPSLLAALANGSKVAPGPSTATPTSERITVLH